jgi:protein ImuA
MIEQMVNIVDSHPSLAGLKRQIAALTPSAWAEGRSRVSFGLDPLDGRLEGGLARGAVHEVLPRAEGDWASASAFALIVARRAAENSGKILWLSSDAQRRRYGTPYGPGLAELGVDPDQIILVYAPDDLACLKAAADSLACTGLAALILDMGATQRLDLTASRRLALAAERSGVTALLLRPPASILASAAASRWQVAAAPSAPLPGNAPGRLTLSIALLRHRGGATPFDMVVEWNNEYRRVCEPTLLRDLPAPHQRRQMVA